MKYFLKFLDFLGLAILLATLFILIYAMMNGYADEVVIVGTLLP
jgi:hypothetical protein